MAIAPLITAGFGSFADVYDIPTRGFEIGVGAGTAYDVTIADAFGLTDSHLGVSDVVVLISDGETSTDSCVNVWSGALAGSGLDYKINDNRPHYSIRDNRPFYSDSNDE